MIGFEWETLFDTSGGGLLTERARVPGGWLVRCRALPGALDAGSVALTFVPDAQGEWEED